jgi:hypothetical protein
LKKTSGKRGFQTSAFGKAALNSREKEGGRPLFQAFSPKPPWFWGKAQKTGGNLESLAFGNRLAVI